MSYEGSEQCICADGHFFVKDAYGESEKCPTCGSEIAFCNGIDDTNCDSWGRIPPEKFQELLIVAAVVETCSHCGHTKQLEAPRYRVPDKEWAAKNRTWYNYETSSTESCQEAIEKQNNAQSHFSV
jgi:rRNA maturation protein Nop10